VECGAGRTTVVDLNINRGSDLLRAMKVELEVIVS